VQNCKLNSAQRFNTTARAADNEVFDPSERAIPTTRGLAAFFPLPCASPSPAATCGPVVPLRSSCRNRHPS
jgi:hypothetical protein